MGKIKTMLRLITDDRQKLKEAIAQNFSGLRISHLISDKAYLKYLYKAAFGKKLNLDDPMTFSEKLQWL